MQKLGGGYEGKPSIFDDIDKEDIIMCFFPCTRFEDQILLSFRGEQYQDRTLTDLSKLERCIKLHGELHENYTLICMLMIICIKKELKIVFENPYSVQHYLQRYWCLKPQIIDKDRTRDGDYYVKPTQYFFVGFSPKNNLVLEPLEFVKKYNIEKGGVEGISCTTARSMIHPQYASRFIKKYLIDYETDINTLFGIS